MGDSNFRSTETIENATVSTPQSTNQEINTTKIDAETLRKLRGDAIGDTMYSERFVLKTLLNFTNLTWNDDVENDLCSLWDMTAETTVCDYLLKLSYPKLACDALLKYPTENRFIEIIIGILANLLCSSSINCIDYINHEVIDTVLNHLETDDPLILIQIMRFIHALLFVSPDNSFLNCNILNQIKFILENSINQQLIVNTLRVIASFTAQMKEDSIILDENLLQSVLIGYEQIIETSNGMMKCSFDDENIKNPTKHLCEILCNFCFCCQSNQNFTIVEKYKERIIIIVEMILHYYTLAENLLPVTDEFRFYLEAFAYICRILQCQFNVKIVNYLVKILSTIIDSSSDDIAECLELFCYMLTTMKVTHKGQISGERLIILLKFVEQERPQYDFDYLANVELLLKS